MSEISQTPLGLQILDEPRVVLEQAEWWEPNSRFAVVRYSIGDAMGDYGLRLDLDKRAFLDSLGDRRLDAAMEDQASSISRSVADAKSSIESSGGRARHLREG